MQSNTITQLSLADYAETTTWNLKEKIERPFITTPVNSLNIFLKFLLEVRVEMKRLKFRLKERQEFIEKYEKPYPFLEDLHKDFTIFIDRYFEIFNKIDLKMAYEYYSDYPTDYHTLGKLFLDYLELFVFLEDEVTLLNDERVLQIEKFVLNDPVKYSKHYPTILKKIEKREKLRVEDYIVVHIKPVLKRLEILKVDALTLEDLNREVNIIYKQDLLQKVIFESGDKSVISEHEHEILSIFFCYFLEINYDNQEYEDFIIKLENYIMHYFPNSFELTKKQEKILKLVRKKVGFRVKKYVQTEYEDLMQILHDYDKILKFKKSGKRKLITSEEDFNLLPRNFSKKEIEEKLKFFLENVFMLSKNMSKEHLPIFGESLEKEKAQAMEIGLEYLSRFVYPVNDILEDEIDRLEDFIFDEKDFHITNPKLCVTKSSLYSRVSERRTSNRLERKFYITKG